MSRKDHRQLSSATCAHRRAQSAQAETRLYTFALTPSPYLNTFSELNGLFTARAATSFQKSHYESARDSPVKARPLSVVAAQFKMASHDEVPGDVILIDSSEEEDFVKGRKRARASAHQSPARSESSSLSSAPSSKRLRLSSPVRGDSSGSEEGEIGESHSAQRRSPGEVSETSRLQAGGQQLQAPVVPQAAPAGAFTASATARQPGGPETAGSVQAQAAPAQNADAAQPAVPDDVSEATSDLPSGVFMPDDAHYWILDSRSFKLPALPKTRAGSWPSRLKDWAHVFVEHNIDQADSLTSQLIVAAYAYYLDNHSGLKLAKRKAAKQAAKQAEESGALAKQLEMTRTTAKAKRRRLAASKAPAEASFPQHSTPSAGSNAEAQPPQQSQQANGDVTKPAAASLPVAPVLTSAEELALQRRYFPSADDPSNVCLTCACEGHTSANCPNTHCKFCLDTGHWDGACPTRERCGKCRQLGHRGDNCTAKVKVTEDDGLVCAYCSATDHLENHCLTLWRTFRGGPEVTKKVASVPVSCAICGGKEHYLSDCSSRQYPANPSYSLATREKYTDRESNTLSIEDAAAADRRANGTATQGPDLRIRGHSGRSTIIHYAESDDSDTEFLGNRLVKKPTGVGQMRMSSNIRMPGGGANGGSNGGNRNQRGQPGPPGAPSGPQSSNSQSRQPGSSLPPRPPAPSRGGAPARGGSSRGGYHNMPPPPGLSGSRSQGENRGGRGGRGGRAGGGGGKGRGRGRGRAK